MKKSKTENDIMLNLGKELREAFGFLLGEKALSDIEGFILVRMEKLSDEFKSEALRQYKIIKYPKLNRKDDLRCKVSDEQIQEIKSRYKKGESQAAIANSLGITRAAVQYWLMTKEQRRAKAIKDHLENKRCGRYEVESYKQAQTDRSKRRLKRINSYSNKMRNVRRWQQKSNLK